MASCFVLVKGNRMTRPVSLTLLKVVFMYVCVLHTRNIIDVIRDLHVSVWESDVV